MVITIKCIICQEDIKHPRIDQLCCSKENCMNEYSQKQQEMWRLDNPRRVRNINRKAYLKRKTTQSKG